MINSMYIIIIFLAVNMGNNSTKMKEENQFIPITGDNKIEVLILYIRNKKEVYYIPQYKDNEQEHVFMQWPYLYYYTTNAFMGTDLTLYRGHEETPICTSSLQIREKSWAFGSDIIGYVKNLKFSKKNLLDLSRIRIVLNLLGNISEGDALHCILRKGSEYKSLMLVLEKGGHEYYIMRYFVNNIFKYLDIV